VRVSGTGFGAHRAVDIYFDTADKALASTNGNGAFSGIRIRVPASAVPGKHYITAVERRTGRSAQAPFLVSTNWAQSRYSPSQTAFNRYENVLSRATVAGLGLRWSVANASSPAVVGGVVYTGSPSALNAATGATLWSNTGVLGGSSPAVANRVVYTGGVSALNAATGAKLWTTYRRGVRLADGGRRPGLHWLHPRGPVRVQRSHRGPTVELPDRRRG
jgi:hypothetical protein